ncbi:ATP-dependent DNA helicase PIF1-like protein [Leptotrombidium deliense]|uniref:ATP-dependent DNA helicase n=1 Tax=Leptotrombidium deliense TaxID=299467 RepID=A0A443SK20_9ACAR|nr:ATP-dependent DNA helicase PIF1-like protein [Leptotrombidium deliense]
MISIFEATCCTALKCVNRNVELIVTAVAPTGRVAFALKGATIHNEFKLPVNTWHFSSLDTESLLELRQKFGKLEYLIIDEISMVSREMLYAIDFRLREIKRDARAFGNVSVLAFGDFNQLAPVSADAIYKNERFFIDFNNHSSHCENNAVNSLWQHFSHVTLRKCMRQKRNKEFSRALNAYGNGEKWTRMQRKLFESRYVHNPHYDDHIPTDCVRLFYSNRDVDAYNKMSLRNVPNVKRSFAYDIVEGECSAEREKQLLDWVWQRKRVDNRNLDNNLLLAINHPYMITSNISVPDGLVNGAIGILRRIDFETNYVARTSFTSSTNSFSSSSSLSTSTLVSFSANANVLSETKSSCQTTSTVLWSTSTLLNDDDAGLVNNDDCLTRKKSVPATLWFEFEDKSIASDLSQNICLNQQCRNCRKIEKNPSAHNIYDVSPEFDLSKFNEHRRKTKCTKKVYNNDDDNLAEEKAATVNVTLNCEIVRLIPISKSKLVVHCEDAYDYADCDVNQNTNKTVISCGAQMMRKRKRFSSKIAMLSSNVVDSNSCLLNENDTAQSKTIRVVRNQFPVILAKAITIHKSQGATYGKIAIKNEPSMCRKLIYVALSRVASIDSLYYYGLRNLERNTFTNDEIEYKRIRQSHWQYHFSPFINIYENISRVNGNQNATSMQQWSLLFMTIESYTHYTHFADIENDYVFRNVDMIVLIDMNRNNSVYRRTTNETRENKQENDSNTHTLLGSQYYNNQSVLIVENKRISFAKNGEHYTYSYDTSVNIHFYMKRETLAHTLLSDCYQLYSNNNLCACRVYEFMGYTKMIVIYCDIKCEIADIKCLLDKMANCAFCCHTMIIENKEYQSFVAVQIGSILYSKYKNIVDQMFSHHNYTNVHAVNQCSYSNTLNDKLLPVSTNSSDFCNVLYSNQLINCSQYTTYFTKYVPIYCFSN